MKHSIVEVIVYLLEIANSQVTKVEDPLSTQGIMQQRLEDAGFSHEVVSDAFDWLRELIEQQCWYAVTRVDNSDSAKSSKTLRIFDPVEKARIKPEVRSFILSLEYAGILDTKMREIVISQLMHLNHRFIELPDAKWVVLLVLMSKLNRNIQEMRSYFLATVVSGA